MWTRTFGDEKSLVGGLSGAVGPDGSVVVTAAFDGDLSVGTTVYPGPALHTGDAQLIREVFRDEPTP